MGKAVQFLIDNAFPFEATVDAPYTRIFASTEDAPAALYNTWTVAFGEQVLVPLCKLEALYFTFTTEQERDTFVSLLRVILNQTQSCCHNCATCDTCAEVLAVDAYNSIVNMPDTCNYEYYLNAACNCADTNCDAIAELVDLCNFVNTTGEKLRAIFDRNQAEGSTVGEIATQKEALLPADLPKTIEATGLSSALLSYEEAGAFRAALVCLERVTAVQFTAV